LTHRSLAVLLSLGFAALAAGCSSSARSPTGPSAGTPAAVTTGGATIRGVVETGGSGSAASSADGVHAFSAAAGVRVSVVGGTASTSTDSAGQFVLPGVPAGRVQLRFESSGIDARLEIDGVAEGQSLNVNVHLSSSGAFLAETDDHRNETTLRGRIDSIDGTRLRVLGRVVQTDNLTQVLGRSDTPVSFSTLKVGDVVEAEGTNQADGSLYARKLKLEDAASGGGGAGGVEDNVNFVGAIQGLSPLVVAGRSVTTDGSTRVLDRKNNPITLSALKVGDTVEVEGSGRADGSVLATKIKQQD
jgi:hypothetical protein